jgi:hypothetical protein
VDIRRGELHDGLGHLRLTGEHLAAPLAMLSSKPKPRPTAKMMANTGMMAIMVLR